MSQLEADDEVTLDDVLEASGITYRVLHHAISIHTLPEPPRVTPVSKGKTKGVGPGTWFTFTPEYLRTVKSAAIIHRVLDIPFPNACRLLLRVNNAGANGPLNQMLKLIAAKEGLK